VSSTSAPYSTPAKAFHWLAAALVLFQVPLAFYMESLPISPDKLETYALHKSIGMTIFTLTAARLAWRLISPPPAMPPGTPGWQSIVARTTHWAMYFILLAMPLTGWLSSSAANFPVSVFGLATLPDLVAPDPQLHEGLEEAHEALGYLLLALLSAHVAAALHHHFWRRDAVLRRMLPFG
jgi:cytochrome b561